MNTQTRKCMYCRERAVHPTTISSFSQEMEHDGRKYLVTVRDFHTLQCSNCGEMVFDEVAIKSLSDQLRQEAGLLAPEEIRAHREALGLTQAELANLLRISPSTLSRWETGAQMQQRVMDAFLRVFFFCPEARAHLGHVTESCTNLLGPSTQRARYVNWRQATPSIAPVLASLEGVHLKPVAPSRAVPVEQTPSPVPEIAA